MRRAEREADGGRGGRAAADMAPTSRAARREIKRDATPQRRIVTCFLATTREPTYQVNVALAGSFLVETVTISLADEFHE